MKLFTIGFTRKSAEVFFTLLRDAGVKRIVDVRLNNVSQLAGFSKKDDLRYFAKALCNIDYIHIPDLAPTAGILDPYKKRKHTDWDLYQQQFLELIHERKIERTLSPDLLDRGCLLCSEESPHHCHRRLVAEYLRDRWKGVEIEHLN